MRRQLFALLFLIIGLVAAAQGGKANGASRGKSGGKKSNGGKKPNGGKGGTMTMGSNNGRNNGTMTAGTNSTMSSNNGTLANGTNSTMPSLNGTLANGTNSTMSSLNGTLANGTNSTQSGANSTSPRFRRSSSLLYVRGEAFKDFKVLANIKPTGTSGSNSTSATATGSGTRATGSGSATAGTNSTTSALSFGKCTNPSILVTTKAAGEGKTESEFAPANQNNFDHGAAPEINTITSFIVNRLESPCGAPASTMKIAKQAEKAVENLKGQVAADTWNRMLGVTPGVSVSGNGNVKVVNVRERRVRTGNLY